LPLLLLLSVRSFSDELRSSFFCMLMCGVVFLSDRCNGQFWLHVVVSQVSSIPLGVGTLHPNLLVLVKRMGTHGRCRKTKTISGFARQDFGRATQIFAKVCIATINYRISQCNIA
jgi:hypothetical protein